MEYVKLGKRGPEISTVGFGAWAIGGLNWGPTDDSESKVALRAALERGVTLIDTADVYGYGHSEELIAEVLSDFDRERVIVATKAGNDFYNATAEDETIYGRIRLNGRRDYILEAAEKSLKRLRSDSLDILQLHSLDTSQLETDEPWEALRLLKEEGKVRYCGWSVKSFKETEQAYLLDRYHELIDCIQVRYNLLERAAEDLLFPRAEEHGIGVIVRIPLLFGLLTGKFSRSQVFAEDDHRSANLSPQKLGSYMDRLEKLEPWFQQFPDQTRAQVSLRFCLSHPACHTVIPGARRPDQAAGNAAVGDMGPIPSTLLPERID